MAYLLLVTPYDDDLRYYWSICNLALILCIACRAKGWQRIDLGKCSFVRVFFTFHTTLYL